MTNITLNESSPICQCLAAWIDTADCVCGEPSGTPMPLDAKALQLAHRLLGEIETLDRAPKIIDRDDRENPSIKVRMEVYSRHGQNDYIELKIPPEFAKALTFYARAQKYDELRRTGIVSTADATVRQIIK